VKLAEEISAAVNTAFKPDARITPSLVQSWRAEVEEELSRIRERLTTAREMEVQFPRLQELTLQLSNLREQYEQRKQALAQAHALLDAQQRELAKLEAGPPVLVERQRSLSGQIDSIEWLIAKCVGVRTAISRGGKYSRLSFSERASNRRRQM